MAETSSLLLSQRLELLIVRCNPFCRGQTLESILSVSADLQKLTHLTLLGLKKVNVDLTFQKLIRQLQSLDFSTRECMSEVIPTPLPIVACTKEMRA